MPYCLLISIFCRSSVSTYRVFASINELIFYERKERSERARSTTGGWSLLPVEDTHPEHEAEHGVLDAELGLRDALQLALLARLLRTAVARVLHTTRHVSTAPRLAAPRHATPHRATPVAAPRRARTATITIISRHRLSKDSPSEESTITHSHVTACHTFIAQVTQTASVWSDLSGAMFSIPRGGDRRIPIKNEARGQPREGRTRHLALVHIS